jgi:hypothetical protein
VKADDLDVVRLLRPLPEHGLSVGAKGTVVFAPSDQGVSPSYLVEFADSDGVTQVLVTVPEEDLEVIWRLGVGWLPGFGPDA